MSETGAIHIDQVAAASLRVPIVGTSPLIMHRFSEKAKKQMLDNMQGRKPPKEFKDPQAEYEAALYTLKDGTYGLPAQSFKQATVSAARFFKGISMTELRQLVFFKGELGADGRQLVRLDGEPTMREDPVNVGGKSKGGGNDLRYRPMFTDWTAVLEVTFVASAITKDSVISLIDAGGLGVGVGDWRPERNGDFGQYQVDPTREIQVVTL